MKKYVLLKNIETNEKFITLKEAQKNLYGYSVTDYNVYICEFCGVYKAKEPKCNKCEKEQ